MKAMVVKLNTKFTVWNLRKGNIGPKKAVRTPEMIASVKKRASFRVFEGGVWAGQGPSL